MFYIMKAHHINNGKGANLVDMTEEETNQTVIQVQSREGKAKKFISGYGDSGYGLSVGSEIDFTFDTGMGHRPGGMAVVVGICKIDKEGNQTVEGEFTKNKLAAYVMK